MGTRKSTVIIIYQFTFIIILQVDELDGAKKSSFVIRGPSLIHVDNTEPLLVEVKKAKVYKGPPQFNVLFTLFNYLQLT